MPCCVDKVRGGSTKCTAGERDNDDFLLHYGFVPPGNPHDSVLLFPSLGAALEWYFDRAAPQVCPSCRVPLAIAGCLGIADNRPLDACLGQGLVRVDNFCSPDL